MSSDLTDLETRLRDELDRQASTVRVAEDPPPQVLAAVREVRRRRRTRLVVGTTAAAACFVAVVAAAALFRSPEPATTVVAGPEGADLVLSDPGPAEFRMRALPDSPLSAREDMASVWTGEELLIWGGRASGTNADDGAAYDPTTRQWRRLAPSPLSGRSRHSAVWTGSEMILWGGTMRAGGVGGLGDGAAYDPVSDSWRSIAAAPFGSDRVFAIGVWAGGRAVFAGGGNSTGDGLSTLLAYDPATDRWEQHQARGSIVGAVPFGDRLAVVTLDQMTLSVADLNVELVDVVTGESAPAGDMEPVADQLRSERVATVGLVEDDTHLLLAVTTMSGDVEVVARSTVAAWSAGATEWTTVGSVDADEFSAGTRPFDPVPPGITAWSGDWLVGWVLTPNAVAPGTSRTIEPPVDAPCGHGSAMAWTGDEILKWGGQNCRREGGTPQVDTGVSIKIVPTE
jgi:hypothetical protein